MNEAFLQVHPLAGATALIVGIVMTVVAACRRWRNRRSFRAAVAKLDETAKELGRLEERYGRYRILDKLAGGDLAKAIVDMGDQPAHWLALGGAFLAAEGDTTLEELCERKIDWLKGEFSGGSYDDFAADALVRLCFDEKTGANRSLSPRQRVVAAGIGTDGKAALALVIKHLSEVFPNEAAQVEADGSAPVAAA